MSGRDGTAQQLSEYKAISKPTTFTTGWGAHVPSMTSSLTAGKRGPLCVQDTVFFDTFHHFNRERIPERVVHAKGAGAFGYFECTKDVTKYTKAVVFSQVGKKTDLAVRFSTTGGESGANETSRESRGFSLKFYTEDGIWDLTALHLPVFFVRDAMIFPSLNHVVKRNPVTHVKDFDAFWDFISLRPELIHSFLHLFSPSGIPDGYRHMNGYAQNIFKLVNTEGEGVWCKFHIITNQGVKNIETAKAIEIAGTDPDYATRDLYNAIHAGKYPKWTLNIQVMTFEEAKSMKWNIFDPTQLWPEDQFPLIEAGNIVLNKNPTNYFSDVEQIAFNPGHLIPGIEPSPDKVLQARLLTYSDAQRYRLGANHLQLPVNCPHHNNKTRVSNEQRDGFATYYNQNGTPNYYPNSFNGPEIDPLAKIQPYEVSGFVDRYDTGDEDNYSGATLFWQKLKLDEQTILVKNLASTLTFAQDFIQERTIKVLSQVDETLAKLVQESINRQIETKNVTGTLW
ncbi:hypothetical protein V9T40_002395 [Parthenolecanium corni]|uniref:Catalase core domain-containing protein n=1 Tax=Parthenolecanium corni TaxID=536013 RepID=A0AAN9TG65_9HEMI